MPEINVNELTFGVEIETTIPAGTIHVGPHGCGAAIANIEGWKADRDPSIRATSGHVACEFVSPVFKGTDGLRQCLADLAKIKALGAQVNDSCGLHVHVGFDKANAAEVTKLATLVANFEKAIYASTGTKKRETGRWCAGLNRYGNAEAAMRQSQWNRYHVLNIATGSKPTVEFRAFGATLNAVKLAGYVRLCIGIVERAMRSSKVTNWTAKTPVDSSPIKRGGEGQTALNRLYYQIGWTKGRQSHVHGDLNGDGLPSMKAVKNELMRLAKKYDAPAPVPTPRPVTPASPTPAPVPTPASRLRFPVGTRIECARIIGMRGTVIRRLPRRSPIIQMDDGRRYRVRVNSLREVPATPAATPAV